MNLVVEAFLIFLPAGLANMMPIFASRLPLINNWSAPISARYLGRNKTWRGIISGVMVATLTGLALANFVDQSWFLGGLMGFGALLGDAVESFFKRQRGIESGEKWFPFDQTDYIIGGLLFALPFGVLTWPIVSTIFALYFGLHLLISYIGYLLGFKPKPI